MPSDDCETPAGAAAALDRRRRRAHPRRVRRARHRGQDRRDPVRPHPRHPDPRACAWACSAWSSRPPATWPGSTAPTPPSSTRAPPHPVIATMADQHDVVAGERDMGGTMRLGAYPALLAAGLGGRGGLRHARGLRAAPAPLRGQQRLPRPARARPAWCSPGPRRTARWSSSSSCPRDVHPFFVGTQAHPELKSRPDPAAPAVRGVRPGRARLPGGRAAAGRAAPRAGDGRFGYRGPVNTILGAPRAVSAPRARLRRRRLRRHLHRQGASRCAATTCAMPGGGTAVREIMRAPRRGRDRRARRRRPADDDPPVPARARRRLWELPAGPAGRRGRGRRWRRPGASWPRRSASRRTSGRC